MMRAFKHSSSWTMEHHGEGLQNGLHKPAVGLTGKVQKVIRRPSFERDQALSRYSASPALDSSTASTRSDSPSVSLASRSGGSGGFGDPPRLISQPAEGVGHIPVSRQYSPNFGMEPPPPPPPPRPQGVTVAPPSPLSVPSRGTTPPPPPMPAVSQPEFRPLQATFIGNSQMQHMMKRISPGPQPSRPPQGVMYSANVSQSSTPQRGTSPVSLARTPMIVQNSLQVQQQLSQHFQALSVYNGVGGAPVDPLPPYPIGPGASKLVPSLPYTQAAASQTRQSPTLSSPTMADYSASVTTQLQKRPTTTSPVFLPQMSAAVGMQAQSPIPTAVLQAGGVSSTTASSGGLPMATTATVVTSAAHRLAPMQVWSTKQQPIIMQSVKSIKVDKPVLQTAIAPTAPSLTSTPPPPPSYSTAMQQMAQLEAHTLSSPTSSTCTTPTFASLPTPAGHTFAGTAGAPGGAASQAQSPTLSAPSAALPTTVPTTDPPSYASTMQALAAQWGMASSTMTTTTLGNAGLTSYNLAPFGIVNPSGAIDPLSSSYNPMNSLPEAQFATVPQSTQITPIESTKALQAATGILSLGVNATAASKANSGVQASTAASPTTTSNLPPHHAPLQRKFSPMSVDSPIVASRSESPVSHTTSQSPVSFMSLSSTTSMHSDSTHDSSGKTTTTSPNPPYKMTHHSPIPERKMRNKDNDEERRETLIRNCSPQAFKFYMEQHVENVLNSCQQRLQRGVQLEDEMNKVKLSAEAKHHMRLMLYQKESNYIRLKRAKMNKDMFTRLDTIGVGAFGEVALVQKRDTQHLYAMKILRKTDVVERNQAAHVKAERDILAEADNEWVVKLYYSFQDKDSLYFVMDYVPGGDLMSLLIKFGIFQEPLARFYIAELVCAIESVHKMGFIHRDIKPDNILIDRDGHIKLTDFGLCTGFRWTHNSKYYQKNGDHSRQDSMEPDENWSNECRCNTGGPALLKPLERRRRREHQRCLAHSLVGTPNYIAPEVLMRTGYTQLCDWWSVGVILYEMLVGQPPFLAGTPAETQYKVIHWEKTLQIPKQANLSAEAKDLILKLCTSHDKRLGKDGALEVKLQAFFSDVDFGAGLRRQPAPYIPTIRHPTDTSNFDQIDPDKLRNSNDERNKHADYNYDNGKLPDHAFFEFTFRRFFDDGGHAYPIRAALDDNDNQAPVYV